MYELVKDNLYKDFRENDANTCLEFHDTYWMGSINDENKQEVTIQQLKEILQPMENKEYLLITEDGYEVKEKENVSWVINDKYKYELTLCEKHKKLIEESEGVYKVFKSKEKALEYHNKMLLSKNSNLPLTEQLEKAKAEVKRLKEAIEEESKPKEITIDISKFDIEHLIKMRNYFGENDKTTFEHASYGVINRIIKQINKQTKRIN